MQPNDTTAAAAPIPPPNPSAAAAVAPAQVPAIDRKYFPALTVAHRHANLGFAQIEVSGHTHGANGGNQDLILNAEVGIKLRQGPLVVDFDCLTPDMARELAQRLISAADFAQWGPAGVTA